MNVQLKNVFSQILGLIAFCLIMSSCKNGDDPVPTPTFSITIEEENTHPTISQEGGTITIPFTATGNWTASLMNDRADGWITLTPSSGDAGDVLLSITTTANDTYDERNATIVLKCGNDTENIVITQKQKDAILVSSSKYEVEADGGDISVEVQANISYDVEVKVDWIKPVGTRSLTTSTLNFSIDPNETGERREGEIVISNGELSETIKVYQSYNDFITLTQKEFTLPEEGGMVDIEIRSTVDYGSKILGDVDWINETSTRAISTHTLHYEVAPNESYDAREAKIVFYNMGDDTLADTVSIYQMYKGAILVAKNEYEFDIHGGNLNFTVKSNLEYEVIVSDEWIQQMETRSLIETELYFTIAENTEGKDREGTITVKDKNSTKQQIVTISQTTTDLEREVLLAFYKLTNGDGWKNNANWCSDRPLSEWYGISTDQDGKVISIHMDRNNLIGQFPSNIGDLSKLRYLSLNDNYLYGEIPESFYNLTELEYFSVSNFNFGSEGGTIIIDPNNPEAPTLGRNQLSGTISEKIGNLKNLYEFSVLQNMLEGELPKAIWTLPKLKALLLTHNKNLYGEIPEDIGNLQNLVQLWLDGNNFSGELPKAITTLANLEELNISYNAFTGELPKDIGKLKKLRQLDCGYNLLIGEIPESIYELTNLHRINMPGYKSSTVVIWADGAHRVENYNHFTGDFLKNIGSFKKLEGINISNNDFTGVIPESFYELSQISNFDIANNNIHGRLSNKIGNLELLNYFIITGCKIEGEIPESVSGMKELQSFVAENNNLTGNVPIGFATLPKFETLYLNGNRLVGVLPKEIVDMDIWNTHDIELVLLPQQDGYGLTIGDYSPEQTRGLRKNDLTVSQIRIGDQITINPLNGRTINIPVKTVR